MTKSEIAALADRALDLAIAEYVFGWCWWRSSLSGGRYIFPDSNVPDWFTDKADGSEPIVSDSDEILEFSLPLYSLTGDGMLAVIERMRERGWFFRLADAAQIDGYFCLFYEPDESNGEAEAETAPLAVCRAALIAVLGAQND